MASHSPNSEDVDSPTGGHEEREGTQMPLELPSPHLYTSAVYIHLFSRPEPGGLYESRNIASLIHPVTSTGDCPSAFPHSPDFLLS